MMMKQLLLFALKVIGVSVIIAACTVMVNLLAFVFGWPQLQGPQGAVMWWTSVAGFCLSNNAFGILRGVK